MSNFVNQLPVIVQKQILGYLNSLEELNYLTAIDLNLKRSSDLFQYLFNDKRINLAKCYQLKHTDLKSILKHYKKPELDILSLDLNFCYNISWTNGLRSLNFQSLNILKIMSLKISTPDLVNLINSCPELQEIAFTVPETYTSGEKYKSYSRGKSYTKLDNLTGFNRIKMITLEFKLGFDRLIFENLMDNFKGCESLEFFSNDDVTVRTDKKLPMLKSFACSGKLCLTITELEDFLGLLDSIELFHLNIRKVNNLNRMYAKSMDFFRLEKLTKLVRQFKCKRFHYHFERADVNLLHRTDPAEELVDLELNGVAKWLENEFVCQLESFKLSTADNCECVLKTVRPFALSPCVESRLRTIDLKGIHVHATESICELLADLKYLEHLFLPCCALACEDWKTKDTKYILKRIFVDEESDTDIKTNESKPTKKQLGYLSKLKLKTFGLHTPKNVSKKDAYYNCRTVDSAELIQITTFPELKKIYFDSFKLLGSPVKFEQIIKELVGALKLTHVSFVQFSSFVLYEYQTKLTNYLDMFATLTHLRIEHKDFHLTEVFLCRLAALTQLTHVKISTKKIDAAVSKNNYFTHLTKLTKLVCLELESDFSNKDIAELTKLFKNVTFVAIRKFPESSHSRDLTSTLSIANMYPKYHSIEFDQ